MEHNWLDSIQGFNWALTFEITLKSYEGRKHYTVNMSLPKVATLAKAGATVFQLMRNNV